MADSGDFPVNEDGWPLAPNGYDLQVEVGAGAFAKVIKARCPSKDVDVAVKVMALENISTSLEEIQAEVRTMKLSRHENVLDLHCCFVVKSDLWLVMPLMDKGSCYYVLRMLRRLGRLHDGQGLSEEVIATLLREVLSGLDYIHGQHQIHRDIKAGNILLNAEGRVAIADFGVAGWLSEAGARSEGERKTFVGTPCWMAPEVRASGGFTRIVTRDVHCARCPPSLLPPLAVASPSLAPRVHPSSSGHGAAARLQREGGHLEPRHHRVGAVQGLRALQQVRAHAGGACVAWCRAASAGSRACASEPRRSRSRRSLAAPLQVLIKTIREPPPSIRSYVDPAGSNPSPPSEKFNKFVARCLQKDPRLR
jgi:serine/threonine protein kinase